MFAVLLAFGVTMLRRQTAVEFAGIEHGQALREFRDQRARAHARRTAPPPHPAADATIAGSAAAERHTAPVATSRRVETLERLAALRASGALTDEEYQGEKTIVMNSGT